MMPLDPSHPSFGCRYVMFLVQVTSGDVQRFIVVPAANPWAIFLMESLGVNEGRISETCRIVAKFRNCYEATMQDDVVDSCAFVDFLVQIVGSDILLGSPVISHAMVQSLTYDEKVEMQRQLGEKIAAKEAQALAETDA